MQGKRNKIKWEENNINSIQRQGIEISKLKERKKLADFILGFESFIVRHIVVLSLPCRYIPP